MKNTEGSVKRCQSQRSKLLIESLAAGRITAKELPIATGQGKRVDTIRVAPGFNAAEKSAAGGTLPSGAYTIDALAKFWEGSQKIFLTHLTFSDFLGSI